MEKSAIGVREIDREVFREFKARAVEENIRLGYALTLAMKQWIEREIKKQREIKMPKLKPFNFGPGNERVSEDIDKILYGK